MARIAYADASTGPAAVLARRIVAERGSLLHLYQMLLHSAPVAEGWLGYLTAIRQHTQLDAVIREMVIMRVAYLNRAPYEADQHAPIARKAGMSAEQLQSLASLEIPMMRFDARQRAALAYTDAMTRQVQVPDAVFDQVREHFPASDLVELTAVIAAYNMVSRFLEALQIHSEDAR